MATVALLWSIGPAAQAQEMKPERLTVAVFDFEAKDKGIGDLGQKIGDLLTVFMAAEDGMDLVERAQIEKIVEEMALGASGIVAPDQATRIGGLIGAQVLVTGRAFVLNEKLYIAGKAISVETGRVNAQLSIGELSGDLDVIVQELASKLATWLRENSDKMVAKIQTPADRVATLRKALGDRKRPTVAATVVEMHVGQRVIDPAAETEIVYLMRKVGIPVITGDKLNISDWAMEFVKDAQLELPPAAKNGDVLIVGEAFSEFAGRTGNLISVKARVELKAIDTKSGQVLAVNRQTATHVDIAEQIAGKTALQKAAGEAAVEMLPEVVEGWNKLEAERAKEAAKEKQ